MKARNRAISMLLVFCMLLSLTTVISALEVNRITHTIKAGQSVELRTDILVVRQYDVSVSETHTSGGAGLEVDVIPDPEDEDFQVVVLKGQLNEPGTYKYTVTAEYRDTFGQPNTRTQDVTVEVVQGYTDVIISDQTNINVNYRDTFEHGLPANAKIDPDRTNTLSLYGLSAACDADLLTITGTTTATGTAQVTVSGTDAEGITSYYTVKITITSPDAFASTVNKNVKVGEKVNLQIVHGLSGTPHWDFDMPNTLGDFDLTATPGEGMLTITGTPLKPGTAEVSFTDGDDRVTIRITISGSDMSAHMTYLELTGLVIPVDGEMPATSIKVDHKAVAVTKVQWTYVKDGEDVNWNHKKAFDLEEKYACYVSLNAMEGYTFAKNMLVYCGDITAEDVVVEGEAENQLTACFYFGYPEEPIDYIDKVRIEDVTFPEAGMTVGDSEDEITDAVSVSGKADLDYVTWSEEDDDGTLSRKHEFVGGDTYTCRFVLECPDGSAFTVDEDGKPDLDVTVNGDDNVTLSIQNDKLIVAYNYTFPKKTIADMIVNLTYSSATVDCNVGDTCTISVTHNIPAEYTVSYQWYYNTTDSSRKGQALVGATQSTLLVPTHIEGINYYYCEVTADGDPCEENMNNPVRVNVKSSDYVFPFTDVPATQWYRQYVEIAHRNGLINGKTEALYKPDDNMTLAECIKLAACMHQLYHDEEVTLQNGNPWYQTYVDYAKENRIIDRNTEYTAEELNTPVTRAVYVNIFCYAMPLEQLKKINEVPTGSLPDVPADHPYAANIYKMYTAGIINGNDAKGTFGPDDNIKKSAVAAILVRMMDPAYRVGAPAELGQ